MVGEVIEVDRYRCLTEELDALNSYLLVLGPLLLSLRVSLERLTELINTALLSWFINLHHNDLFQ